MTKASLMLTSKLKKKVKAFKFNNCRASIGIKFVDFVKTSFMNKIKTKIYK